MNKNEFTELVRDTLTKQGYKKIRINTALLAKRAEISALDPGGRKCRLEAELMWKRGKEILRIRQAKDLSWIDELEILDILADK